MKNVFNVDKSEKNRILKLHRNVILEQKYAEDYINMGGKIIPTSNITMNFYNSVKSGNKNELFDVIQKQIKGPSDLNILNDELKKITGKDITSHLNDALRSVIAQKRESSNVILQKIKNHFRNIADVEYKSEGNQYINDTLKITIKFPNVKKNSGQQQQQQQQQQPDKTYAKAQGYVNQNDSDPSLITSGQKIIGLGARGPLVKQVQALLVKQYPDKAALIGGNAGCSPQNANSCDGVWGKNSMAYAADFQRKQNLYTRKNGVVGKITYNALIDSAK